MCVHRVSQALRLRVPVAPVPTRSVVPAVHAGPGEATRAPHGSGRLLGGRAAKPGSRASDALGDRPRAPRLEGHSVLLLWPLPAGAAGPNRCPPGPPGSAPRAGEHASSCHSAGDAAGGQLGERPEAGVPPGCAPSRRQGKKRAEGLEASVGLGAHGPAASGCGLNFRGPRLCTSLPTLSSGD